MPSGPVRALKTSVSGMSETTLTREEEQSEGAGRFPEEAGVRQERGLGTALAQARMTPGMGAGVGGLILEEDGTGVALTSPPEEDRRPMWSLF